MKKVIVLILSMLANFIAGAQERNNVYADISFSNLGFSVTYDKKVINHLNLGAGINTFNFQNASFSNVRSACYLDLRPFTVIKNNLLFAFANIGAALNSGRRSDSATFSPVSLYSALGIGYGYRINKKGMGPYLSIGMYGYKESVHLKNDNLAPEARDYSTLDANLVMSIGFKF